jgi:hypothetical protein
MSTLALRIVDTCSFVAVAGAVFAIWFAYDTGLFISRIG